MSPLFVLSGCVIDERAIGEFREHLNQVKFATWKEQWKKVSLRSAEIGRGDGFFRKLYDIDPTTRERVPNEKMDLFCRDLRGFFKRKYFSLLCCVVDKQKAVKEKVIVLPKGKKKMKYIWTQELVYKLTYREVLRNFLYFLVARKSCGKILAEASTDYQDIILYKEFFSLQSGGVLELDVDHTEVKERIPSLSFVTKYNRDPEEEIADMMGYAARLCFEIENGIKSEEDLSNYDRAVHKVFKENLLKVAKNRSDKRLQRISRVINPYIVLPSE